MAEHFVTEALLPGDVREHQRGLRGRLVLARRQQSGARFAQFGGALVGLPIDGATAAE